MIKLAKKKTFGEWVDMGDGVSFKLDYPTREQERELQNILIQLGEMEGEFSPAQLDYMRYYIKYTVKDWKDLDVPCRLVNNELEDSLWEDLINDVQQTMDIWVKINSELEFTEDDKKK